MGSEEKPFIREVILEDFMSHEYTRVRLAPGLNVVLGPNGAGKSSMLIGISLALGQSHTERSRRLSELVRYGRRQARITLLLDNTARRGRKPLPRMGEVIRLTRVIRRSGDYWFEIDFRRADKVEVVGMLKSLGLNPDNMLVIMHQGVIDEFTVLSPQQRLELVEEATGISGYRRRLERALARLEAIKAEEKEKEKQIEQLKAMESHWRSLYEKIEERKRLERELEKLREHLAWARIARLEDALAKTREKREKAEKEAEKLRSMAASLAEQLARDRREFEALLPSGSRERLLRLLDRMLYESGEKAVAEYKASMLEEEAKKLRRDEKRHQTELEEAKKLVGGKSRPQEILGLEEAEEKLRIVEAKIKALGDIPEEVEKLYEDIRARISSVSERIRELARNKATLIEEINRRMEVWRREVNKLVDDVNKSFKELLASIGATGYVRVVYGESPSEAGLEIYVGFKGSEPVLLDPYRQSGGERSATVTAFLLALQRRVLSPFRAVDEFDVHMDPSNRAAFFKAMHEMFRKERGVQYLVITPGMPSYVDPGAHYIVVQKTGGVSVAAEAAEKAT